MLLYLNLNTNMVLQSHAEARGYLIFSAISILQQKIRRMGKVWIDQLSILRYYGQLPMIYLTNCFHFVSVITKLNTSFCICGKFISSSSFCTRWILIIPIPWVTHMIWHTYTVIKSGQSLIDENPEAINTTKFFIWTTWPYYWLILLILILNQSYQTLLAD